MDAKEIKQLEPMLNDYLRQFDDCFGRIEPTQLLRTYVTGQLSDLQRKSIEPMADAAGLPPRNLQQFLSRHKWNDNLMRDRIQQIVANEHRHPCSIGIIDETGHPKKGNKTPGVKRQWCGNTGKMDNCVVTVHLNYTAGDFHCLLDSELFLPESWADDRERCDIAGLPSDMTHRTKWEIALDLYQRTVANGVRFEWIGADEGYGKVPEFLFRLDDLGQRYVVEVPNIFTGWLVKPKLLYKEHHAHKMGRKRKFPRLQAQNAATSSVKDMLSYSPVLREIPWEKFYIKDTTKGPIVWKAKAARIYLKRDGLPTRAHWLVVACNVENPDEIKYFLSNAPDGTPLEMLLHVGFSRWHVERCFEDTKSELGFSHFEIRNYQSLLRHMIITTVSYLFLAEVKMLWGEKKSRADNMPDSRCGVIAGSFVLADKPGRDEIPEAHSQDYYANATAYSRLSPLPYKEKETAVT